MKAMWKVTFCLVVAAMFVVPVGGIGTDITDTNDCSQSSSPVVLLLVSENIYPEIEQNLTIFKQDITNEGYLVQLEEVNESIAPPEVREMLQSYYNEYNLHGAILVGDIPAAYTEIHTGSGEPGDIEVWISLDAFDMYYMDLDGKWDHVENPDFCEDAPPKVEECHTRDSCWAFKNEYVVYMNDEERKWDYSFPQGYDYIDNKEQYKAEIWVTRIMAYNLDIPGKNEADIINEYFEHNHKYKAGIYDVSDTAYLCDAISDPVEDHDMDFSNILSTVRRKPHITKDEYTALLETPEGSKLVFLGAHSAPRFHNLYRGRLTVEELLDLHKTSLFYILNACSACRWDQYLLEPGDPNYLGGIYAFDINNEEKTNNGLAAIGFTGVGGFNNLYYLTDYLQSHTDANYGNAWKYYFNHNLLDIFQPWNYVYLGDPTIGPHIPNHPPIAPSAPHGPSSVRIGTASEYSASTIDKDGDTICYGWDWNGDSIVDEWTNSSDSGESMVSTHSWQEEGIYEVQVKAQDDEGYNSPWSASIEVAVTNETEPPSLEIIEPKKGHIYFKGNEIRPTFLGFTLIIGEQRISINADDNFAMHKVEFYIDDELKHTISGESATYHWNWDESTAWGKQTIKVVAYDKAGNSASEELTAWAFI